MSNKDFGLILPSLNLEGDEAEEKISCIVVYDFYIFHVVCCTTILFFEL